MWFSTNPHLDCTGRFRSHSVGESVFTTWYPWEMGGKRRNYRMSVIELGVIINNNQSCPQRLSWRIHWYGHDQSALLAKTLLCSGRDWPGTRLSGIYYPPLHHCERSVSQLFGKNYSRLLNKHPISFFLIRICRSTKICRRSFNKKLPTTLNLSRNKAILWNRHRCDISQKREISLFYFFPESPSSGLLFYITFYFSTLFLLFWIGPTSGMIFEH